MPKREPDWTAVQAAFEATGSGRARSVVLLHDYCKPVDWAGGAGFTGSAFGTFDGGGDAPDVRNRFTTGDIVAVFFLGVPVPARAAHVLTRDVDGTFSNLLAEIPTKLDLHLVDEPLKDVVPATWSLDSAVDALGGMGRTKTSKLLARKRPHLLPVLDTVTMKALGNPQIVWEPLRLRLRAGLAEQLHALAQEAAVPDHVSVLRVLDVVLWMRHRRLPRVA